jgi:hypothetical protein
MSIGLLKITTLGENILTLMILKLLIFNLELIHQVFFQRYQYILRAISLCPLRLGYSKSECG